MSAATDLRHMTSNPTLASPRMSQLLRPHSPARSPTSIPSSPTSVHSSSSAIFERDIEPLAPPSPQHHSTNAHRIPRSKATEQIEHSVPSVLDSAAAILASIQNTNDIAIVSPAPFAGSGFASPIGSFRSRSPSPTMGSLTAHGRNSLLLSIPQQQQQGLVASPPTVRCPPIQTTQSPPAIVTPTSAYFSVADESDTGQPSESGQDEIPTTPPPAAPSSLPALSSSPASTHIASQPHSPLSAPNAASKRLSFISYADLLTSTPTSTLPLSSLTTAASTSEPPPHITGVSVAASHPGSAGTSLRGFAMGPHDAFGPTAANTGSQTGSPKAKRDSIALGLMGPGHPAAVDDVGGEWEREGLGRGLAERLDVLYGTANT